MSLPNTADNGNNLVQNREEREIMDKILAVAKDYPQLDQPPALVDVFESRKKWMNQRHFIVRIYQIICRLQKLVRTIFWIMMGSI